MKKPTFLLLFLFFLASFVPAQTSQQPPQPPPTSHADQDDQQEKNHKITPDEAKELFQSVDQILHFASNDTLLPMKHSVKKAMVSRDEVEKYIGDKFKDDVDRIRFERSELVLKKFGLLPRKFNLHDFLIKLLGEQVAGYYDEKKKTINLLDWVAMDMQKPVMAHELTHALQDQSFDLTKMSKKDEEVEKRGPEDPNALIQIDEESTARTAVMEGEAMIVFADYLLNTTDADNSCTDPVQCPIPTKRSVVDVPGFVDLMLAQMDKEKGDSLLDNAPLLLREELIFPYSQGMKFIAKLLVSGGKQLAFTKVMERMPRTSREIMQPEEYLAGRVVPPLLLPDFSYLKSDFEPFDAGAMGQLDVSILLKQYTEEAVADRLSPEWRGGAYYAVGRKGAKPPDPNSTAHVGLIYVSKWANEKSAKEFARIYGSALPGRYNKVEHAQDSAAGQDKYLSADGPIYIQQNGPLVIAVESFNDAVAEKLIQSILTQPAQSVRASNQ